MTLADPRYVRRDRRIYRGSHCVLCGSCYGICPGEPRAHRPTTCLACNSPQCWTNGMRSGCCSICLIGLLPCYSGWDRMCQYKGCGSRAIVRVDGQNRFRCRHHLERGKWLGYIDARLAQRDKQWELIGPCEVPLRKSFDDSGA